MSEIALVDLRLNYQVNWQTDGSDSFGMSGGVLHSIRLQSILDTGELTSPDTADVVWEDSSMCECDRTRPKGGSIAVVSHPRIELCGPVNIVYGGVPYLLTTVLSQGNSGYSQGCLIFENIEYESQSLTENQHLHSNLFLNFSQSVKLVPKNEVFGSPAACVERSDDFLCLTYPEVLLTFQIR